ncbi:DEAD/DEAH box helicase [Paracrocinitomix mangrovi]|uniref:DEAD/DEAH box helicase n=1 Tax=Paracrocinitomix mangrovi TaxID=2862509 RepID=UPI001C8ECB5B|nr:DEAD/DEAH box helicase [Paracrocinitomix mangrovi]UKN03082.1 DEAD/DEAH box helicase [Paracrocinitomix mangrovi]
MEFKELGLGEELLAAINELGFKEPTPIQEQAIPHLLEDPTDLIGLASTGTGKTASFGLPLLHYVDLEMNHTQGLVIAPTRELCIQIANDLEMFGKRMKKLKIVSVYGGTDIRKQIKELERGAQIIVATPGRLVDLINRKKVRINDIDTVVLDEADEMLNMGFKEDIDTILKQTPKDKCVWLFSATMPDEVARIARTYMVEPFEITVGSKNVTNKNIEHQAYTVKERDRYFALKRLIDFNPNIYGLIFCRTRRETAEVADKLMAEGYSAEPLHGDLSQAQRDRVMGKFRDKHIQILVATDVAARGIDVDDITHVIHYKLPEDVENYTHRSGRTARAGKKGISIALINTKEGRKLKSIEKIIQTNFDIKKLPTPDEICEKQLFKLVENVENEVVNDKAIDKYLPEVMKKFDDLTREEIVRKFISVEFNKFLNYYANSKNLDADFNESKGKGRDGRDGRERRDNRMDDDKERFFVNLGRKDGLNQGALVRLICDNTGLKNKSIGRIDIMNNFSFFDGDKEHKETFIKKLQDVNFEGKSMNVEVTKDGGGKGGNGKKKRKPSSKERNRRRK